MKKLVALLLVAFLLALTGCKGDPASSQESAAPPPPSSSTVESSEGSETDASSSASQEPQSSEESKPGVNSSASKKPPSSAASSVPESSAPASSQAEKIKIVVPEGYTFMQIAKLLESNGICSSASFYSAAQSYTPKSFSIPTSASRCFKLEGYLFPATYSFASNTEPNEVIRQMLNAYRNNTGVPSDKTLILASIIEREARSAGHMAKVSSVFQNRLAAGMRLEADPTRDYVNNYITGNALVKNQSKYAPLYNTYKCKALPAGPICNPGLKAINAAKNPQKTKYLYFFFGNDNENHYSETLEEHNAAIEKYGIQYK